MKIVSQTFIAVLILFSVSITQSAWATCLPQDMTGNWTTYINTEDGFITCRLNFFSFSQNFDAKCNHSNGGTYSGFFGTFELRPSCSGKAEVLLQQDNFFSTGSLRLSQFTMTRDKLMFVGIGRSPIGGKITYTGVRH